MYRYCVICRVTVKDKKFNSTYSIGICKNLMPDEWDQHAGALEHTQDNRTIILGRYNDSAIMYGCEYYIIDKVKSVWRACPAPIDSNSTQL